MQVRDPLSAIPSLVTEIPFWRNHVKDRIDGENDRQTPAKRIKLTDIVPVDLSVSDVHIALQIWVFWNARIDRMDFIPVHRVEDFSLLALLRSAGYSNDELGIGADGGQITEQDVQSCYQKLGGYNSRQHASAHISWHDLFQENASLATTAFEMAERYGYRYWTGDITQDTLVFPPPLMHTVENTNTFSVHQGIQNRVTRTQNLAVNFGSKSTFKFNMCRHGIVRKSLSKLKKRGDAIPP